MYIIIIGKNLPPYLHTTVNVPLSRPYYICGLSRFLHHSIENKHPGTRLASHQSGPLLKPLNVPILFL